MIDANYNMKFPNLPEHIKGNRHDVVSMICADNVESAKIIYDDVVKRLKKVKSWYSNSKNVKAKFTIINSKTELETNKFEIGNLIRIEIPGPGNVSGKGYDWTEIIEMQINKDEFCEVPFFAMTIKPCSPPKADSNIIAHFYKQKASNTFIIRRIGDCVYAEVHGRNETINISDVPILDGIRNVGINIGSKLGLGGLNWLALTKALLEPEN